MLVFPNNFYMLFQLFDIFVNTSSMSLILNLIKDWREADNQIVEALLRLWRE